MANQQDKKTLGLGLDQPEPNTSGVAAGNMPASTFQGASSPNMPEADQPISEKVGSTASGIIDKAKETASGTYDAVATQATTKIEERKGELSIGLRTLADTFRRTGIDLRATPQSTPLTDFTSRYTGAAANQIEKLANYFERKNLRAMMRDTEDFARRNPAIFLGAAFGLGLVAARFLKSSPPAKTSIGSQNPNTGLPTSLPPSTERPNPMPTNP